MSYFELDFCIDFNINVAHQCVQWHFHNAVQFSYFFLQVHALQQARLQPHLTSFWQAILTSGIDIHTGRSLFSIFFQPYSSGSGVFISATFAI